MRCLVKLFSETSHKLSIFLTSSTGPAVKPDWFSKRGRDCKGHANPGVQTTCQPRPDRLVLDSSILAFPANQAFFDIADTTYTERENKYDDIITK